MEFPKEIKYSYNYVSDAPDIIIRGYGEPPGVKIVEYVLVKTIASLYIYKQRGC